MQRCPCCHARLGVGPVCARCATDLSRVIRCEQLAGEWLSVALQTLAAGQANLAVPAVERSLSFKQTKAARLFRDFLVQHQYQALYASIAQKQWQAAEQTIIRLLVLEGRNETLRRFQALLEHLTVKQPPPIL